MTKRSEKNATEPKRQREQAWAAGRSAPPPKRRTAAEMQTRFARLEQQSRELDEKMDYLLAD